jgi:uncharacterized Zn finger protein (UPF0148 family)
MSDFDKEAERERLREKYEQEEGQRETTERMSELLLKGATMTNAHCGACGDPVFRYEGQEFCPTCQEVVTGEDEAAEGETQQASETTEESAAEATGEPEPTANGTSAEEVAEQEPETERSATDPEPADLPERRERAQVPDRDRTPSEPPRRPEPPARRESEPRQSADQRANVSGDLSEARESLRRSLVRFAREAERADDPRRAAEHLEAAHEAAEALATVSEIR